MMEGIASEVASIAGHLRLSNLCWIYESNRVTIEGHTDIAFTEDVAARFMGYGWEVTRVTDPNDIGMIERAYREFEATKKSSDAVAEHFGFTAEHVIAAAKETLARARQA
jgi:transketolase